MPPASSPTELRTTVDERSRHAYHGPPPPAPGFVSRAPAQISPAVERLAPPGPPAGPTGPSPDGLPGADMAAATEAATAVATPTAAVGPSPVLTGTAAMPANGTPATSADGASANGAPANGAGEPTLGGLAVRGGAYLVGREAVGMVIRLVGVVVTVREIGPSNYGIYSAAAAYVLFVATLAQLGAEVYLIRMPGEVEKEQYDQAFTLLVCTSVVLLAISEAATFALSPFLRPVGVVFPLQILLLSIPVNVLWAPAQACIERRFGYRQMGILEVGGDLALYGTAVPMAVLGYGPWSLVAGYCAWQTFLFFGSLVMSGLRPRWNWSTPVMRELLRHGLSFSSANWVTRLGGLVNPLVVGTVAGAAGVGFVSFAQRLVDTIGFAQRGAYRLGLVAMSKVHDDDQHRLRYGIERGSLLQLVALAVPFAAFGVLAHWLIPLLFGSAWTTAIPIYCLLSLAAVLNASCLIQNTLLLSRGQNLTVAGGAVVQTVSLAVAAVALVPALGVNGFGVASLVALVDLIYTNHMARRLAHFSYRSMIPFALALCPPVLMPLVPLSLAPLLFLPMAALVVVPSLRRELFDLAVVVRSALSRRGAA